MLQRIIWAVLLSLGLSTAINSATVKGRVVEMLSDEPVKHKPILLNDTATNTITDDSVFFKLSITTPGEYYITASGLICWNNFRYFDITDSNQILDIGYLRVIPYKAYALITIKGNDGNVTYDSTEMEGYHWIADHYGEIYIYPDNKIVFDLPRFYDIGSYVPLAITEYSTKPDTLEARRKFARRHHCIYNDIEYNFTVNDSNLVNNIYTNDTLFNTSEGLKIGDNFIDAEKYISDKNNLIKGELGYYIPLPSGWNAAFCIGVSGTDHPPDSNSTISWFFKN